jgi:hypothetical protein
MAPISTRPGRRSTERRARVGLSKAPRHGDGEPVPRMSLSWAGRHTGEKIQSRALRWAGITSPSSSLTSDSR